MIACLYVEVNWARMMGSAPSRFYLLGQFASCMVTGSATPPFPRFQPTIGVRLIDLWNRPSRGIGFAVSLWLRLLLIFFSLNGFNHNSARDKWGGGSATYVHYYLNLSALLQNKSVLISRVRYDLRGGTTVAYRYISHGKAHS